MTANNSSGCDLCGRRGVRTTRHHLIPRRTHRLKRIRKRFDRDDRLGRILHVCRSCHSHIHAVLDEKALAEIYNPCRAAGAAGDRPVRRLDRRQAARFPASHTAPAQT